MAMEPMSVVYRGHAAQEQSYADESTLDNVRALHTRASAKWMDLAALAEKSEGRVSRR